jgi:predicted phosphodiesterase
MNIQKSDAISLLILMAIIVIVLSNSIIITPFFIVPPLQEHPSSAYAQTLPNFNFGAVGDWGCNSNTRSTVNNIVGKNTELVLGLGDFSYESTANCWLNIVDPIDHKMKISIGNHDDISSSLLNQYMNHFGLSKQFYSFNYQNVHFVVMSTELTYTAGSEQYNFVNNDLSNAAADPNIDWVVVLYHKLAYTSLGTSSTSTGITELRNTYHPLFDQYGVDLVLQGHIHNYQRSYPITYNSNSPSNPIIADANTNNYNDPQGQIYATVGTGGINLAGLSNQASYIVYQQTSNFGFLNIDVIEGGSKLTASFYANDGTVKDRFSITKSDTSPPPDTTPPSQVTGLAATTASSSQINLSWTANPTADGVTRYNIYRGTTAGFTVTPGITPPTATSTTISYSDTGLTPSTTYYYRVAAVDAAGNVGLPSSEVSATTSGSGSSVYHYEPYLTLSGSNRQDVASSSSLQLTAFSVATWFMTSQDYSTTAYIVNKGGSGTDTAGRNMNYGIWMTSAERIQAGFETGPGTNYFATSPASYNDGKWHYAVVTYDGSTAARLYIDGVQVSSISTSGAIPDKTGTQPVRIGANSLSLNGFFIGNVDEVRVWNRALSSTETADAYNNGVFSTSGQVIYLPFG